MQTQPIISYKSSVVHHGIQKIFHTGPSVNTTPKHLIRHLTTDRSLLSTMHSITFLTSIFAALCVAAPQGEPQPQTCTPHSQLTADIFNAGTLTGHICTGDARYTYYLNCTENTLATVPRNDLLYALAGVTRAATMLVEDGGPTAQLADFPKVPRLSQSCQGETCVKLDARPERGWTAEVISNVIIDIQNWVVNDHNPARVWVGCGFAASSSDKEGLGFAQGCFARKGTEGDVYPCV